MNLLPRSNIFEAGTASAAALFENHVEGIGENGSCIVLALSQQPLEAVAQDAIEKSLSALGYGQDICTYATLLPHSAGESEMELDPQALFLLVEGLDPLCVIAADAAATQALGRAYRTEFALDSPIRVFGRPAVSFRDLTSLLTTNDGKQRAWRIFKGIPKC